MLIGVLIPDYILTVLTVIMLRRPRYLLLGLGFPLMRILDAVLCLRMLPKAFVGRSSGVWVSPTRRANPNAPTAPSVSILEPILEPVTAGRGALRPASQSLAKG